MSSDLIAYLIAAITMIVSALIAFGFPALAIVAVRYFKLKERELTLEAEYRQSSEQQQLAFEQRVQHLEATLASLDHDVRAQLGIGPEPAVPSHEDLPEGPASAHAAGAESLEPSRTKAR